MNICIEVSEMKYVRLIYLLSQIVIYIIYHLLHVLMQTKKSLILQSVGTIFREHLSLSVT